MGWAFCMSHLTSLVSDLCRGTADTWPPSENQAQSPPQWGLPDPHLIDPSFFEEETETDDTEVPVGNFSPSTLEAGIATCSSILAWRIPWTEEPGGLPYTGSHRVGHDWSNLAHTPLEEKRTRTDNKGTHT